MLGSIYLRASRLYTTRASLVLRPSSYTFEYRRSVASMAATKRKRSSVDTSKVNGDMPPPPIKRRASARNSTSAATVNPNISGEVIDAPVALRASPDGDMNSDIVPGLIKQESGIRGESPLSDAPDVVEPPAAKKGKGRKRKVEDQVKDLESVIDKVVNHTATNGSPATNGNAAKKGKVASKVKQEVTDGEQPPPAVPKAAKPKKATDEVYDPDAEDDEEAGEEEVKEALSRPPPVNSDYLPLPWKGRLGYACLNTYLRNSNPPVFQSRTCRIQSILEHRHPLVDPTQPEHPTRNRPDKNKPADLELGHRYVEALGLANVKDITKMVRWNDRYNIKFLRLSSEMFPFASHPEYGYNLAPFASEALAEVGKVIAELGHRVTTHPGQFTQLGSPRKPVIDNAIRDLAYHAELLSLLKLPEQQDRDAVMILHLGGVFEGKEETLQRFRENYAKLSQNIKNRLVLENDDVSWHVHDLLPVCEELNIPFVLDYHHHNIIFDSTQIREGTKDIIELYPRIKATWDRKRITQKMHYSEPTPAAITGRQRRKHNPRVATLPPSAQDMDIMIEAKDKEQAVFELMRTFKLPGFETFNDVIPYTRSDDNKVALAAMAKKERSSKFKKAQQDDEEPDPDLIPEEDVGLGGPEGRVYWPPGMEEWLRPKKREVKKKGPLVKATDQIKDEVAEEVAVKAEPQKKKTKKEIQAEADAEAGEDEQDATPATKKAKAAMKKKEREAAAKTAAAPVKPAGKKSKPQKEAQAPVPSLPSDESDELELDDEDDEEDEQPVSPAAKRRSTISRQSSGRKTKKAVKYNEDEDAEMAEA